MQPHVERRGHHRRQRHRDGAEVDEDNVDGVRRSVGQGVERCGEGSRLTHSRITGNGDRLGLFRKGLPRIPSTV